MKFILLEFVSIKRIYWGKGRPGLERILEARPVVGLPAALGL